MSAIELLKRAVEFDTVGRRLEALKLYEQGIDELLKMCKASPVENDPAKKSYLQNKIGDYMTHAEKLKQIVAAMPSRGEIVDKIAIIEDSRGHSFKSLFGKYLDTNVKEVLVDEPYLRQHYQLCNLIQFLEAVVSNCRNVKFIKVVTVRDARPESDQLKAFDSLRSDLQTRAVTLHFEFVENLHDRQIILSNGYTIKIGRGLNFFKSPIAKYALGMYDATYRICQATNVDIFFCAENKK